MSVTRAQGLVKRYGNTAALDGFDLTIEPGRIVGLIGPNGSGKTTALKSILGLCALDAGSLQVLGLNPYRERPALMRRTTYIADTGILPRWMKVAHLLEFVASVNPAFSHDAALAALANTEVKLSARIKTLSKGMNVQLHLAIALSSNAEFLVLDEPTLGLDILYRQRFYDALLNDYFEDQRSILVTTHEVREIEHILTDVVLINHGRAVLSASMDELAQRFTKVTAPPELSTSLLGLNPISTRKTLQGTEYVFDGVTRERFTEMVDPQQVVTPNLADLFVAVMGGNT